MKPTIKIDLSRDAHLSSAAIATLKDRYLTKKESSPQEAFARAALAFADDIHHAQRIYDYVSKGWFMYATPILSNAPERIAFAPAGSRWGDNFNPELFAPHSRGLPISCFLTYVHDSINGLNEHTVETRNLSVVGGGVGAHWSDVRGAGGKAPGTIPFLKTHDADVLAYHQGNTRRGSYAAYLDISHPDIEEFLGIRKPAGGDINRKALNIHHGVNIPDAFMEIIERCEENPDADDSWQLICPHKGTVVKTVSARALWEKLISIRHSDGEPYIFFSDLVNRALPQTQREQGLKCNGSNLCTEITLATDTDRTAVCCLSSVNLEMWEEWKHDERFIGDIVRFLDNVLEYFIRNAPDELAKAVYSAKMERSIGLGALGFHALLQSMSIPMETPMAAGLNRIIFRHIKQKAEDATFALAKERGEAPDMRGTGRRHAHLLSIAPNASSGIIAGTSPSIEPYRANAFTQKTLSGSFLIKNKHLDRVIRQHYRRIYGDAGYDYGPGEEAWVEEQWSFIITNEGSVQHLEFLTPWEKDVFKTAMEIDQRYLVDLAADRQEYICQAQSLNLFVPADAPIPYVHHLHVRAWKKGVKTLYYLRSSAIRRAENVSKQISRQELLGAASETCLNCEG